MKKIYFFNTIIFCLLLCTVMISCGTLKSEKNQFSAYSMEYFDTVITITGFAHSKEEFDAVANDALSLLGEYHRLYSIYHRFDGLENLCTINELTDGEHPTVKVDKRIIDLLLYIRVFGKYHPLN